MQSDKPTSALKPEAIRLLLRCALAAVVLAVLAYTQADPDLWGHVKFGHDIVTSRHIPSTDPYSFTSDRMWINHEWLSECAMYLAYAAAGGTGLFFLKVGLLVVMLAAIMTTLRALAAPTEIQDLLVGVVIITTLPQSTSVRPQLFSLALFAWLLAILMRAAHKRQPLLILSAVPMMAVWVNVHGGWIVGAGTLGLWSGLSLSTARTKRERQLVLAAYPVALLATLVNPYGWRLWSFLSETVGFGRFGIAEWQPIYRAPTPVVPILWAAVAAVAIASLTKAAITRSLDLRLVAVPVLLGVGSFVVNRLLGFFAVATVMLLAPRLLVRPERAATRPGSQPPPRIAAAVLAAAGLALLVGSAAQAVANARCIRIDASIFPEPEVVSFVSQRHLSGRMLTWFNWGEYAIWHFSPAIVVSMDGRRETVYSDEALRRQEGLFDIGSPKRHQIVQSLRPDFIWLPVSLEVTRLLRSDGWIPIFLGPRSVVLAKSGPTLTRDSSSELGARCFPGP